MEGWHGVRFDRPVAPHPGDHRDHPHGQRRRAAQLRRRDLHAAAARRRGPQPSARSCPPTHIPIYVAVARARRTSASPASSPTAGSATRSSPRRPTCSSTRSGRAPAGAGATSPTSTSPSSVGVEFTDDVEEAGRRHADGYAFTFGAMGSATTQLLQRRLRPAGLRRRRRARCSGSGSPATRKRRGRRVPIEIGLGTNLIGTDDMIRDRLRLYRDAGITTLRVGLGRRRPRRPARRPRPPARPRRRGQRRDRPTSRLRSVRRRGPRRPCWEGAMPDLDPLCIGTCASAPMVSRRTCTCTAVEPLPVRFSGTGQRPRTLISLPTGVL